jgi:hypothetical protein
LKGPAHLDAKRQWIEVAVHRTITTIVMGLSVRDNTNVAAQASNYLEHMEGFGRG